MNKKVRVIHKPKIKTRRHHNNKGYRGIRNGTYAKQMKIFAKKNGIPFKQRG